MRLSELQRVPIVDRSGGALDHVRDIRLEMRDGRWVTTEVTLGAGAIAHRLGFLHGIVERPVLLAKLMKWLGRRALAVEWSELEIEGIRIRVTTSKDHLGHRRRRGD